MDVWNLSEVAVEPHKPVVLHSDEGAARVVVIDLPAGEELGEHEVHEHAWLHVHRGELEVSSGDRNERAAAGALVHWSPQQRHAVRAIDNALLVLVLAPWPGPGHPNLRAG